MVQLQTFTKWDYLLQKIVALIISYKIERKMGKKLFNSFKISKHKISKFSGRLLVGQNDSLDEFFLRFKKGRNDLTHTFWC